MIKFKIATEDDSAAILKLIDASPQKSIVTLNFERQPDFFFGSKVANQEVTVLVGVDDKTGDVASVASSGRRWVYVNGIKTNVRYISDLRISSTQRGGRLLLKIFRELKKLMAGQEYSQTVILKENTQSLTTVASGRGGLARYHPYKKLMTYVVSTSFDLAPAYVYNVRKATQADVRLMQGFFDRQAPKKQFYPVYDFSQIGQSDYYRDLSIDDYYLAFKDDQLVGITATWNQKSFKQTRVVDYPAWMALARPFYNVWSRFFGGFCLPVKGRVVDYLSLHTLITQNNDPCILSALLKTIRRDIARLGESTMVVGLVEGDPLNDALKGFRFRVMCSNHYLVSYGEESIKDIDDALPLYLEVARL